MAVGGDIGCFLGRPRGRFTMILFGEGSGSSAEGAIFRSSTSSSSNSSILGTMSSLGASLMDRKLKLKVEAGLRGDSLDEGDACEDELMLRRVLDRGGTGPKTTSVAIRKEYRSAAGTKAGGGGLRTLVGVGQCSQSDDGGVRSGSEVGLPSSCRVESAGAEDSKVAAAMVTVELEEAGKGEGVGGLRPPEESSRLQHHPTARVEGREGKLQRWDRRF